jgi:hypothetical protein
MLSSWNVVRTRRILMSDSKDEPTLALARRLALELDGAAGIEIDRTGIGLVVRVAGRVSEVFACRRSRVTVTLPDGSAEVETGYDGVIALLPLPLWPRWSWVTRYLAYR